jgi:hypothetical protein
MGQLQASHFGGAQQAFEMRLELVQLAIDDHRCIEYGVTTVYHVVVERQNHTRRVGNNAAQDAGVHGVEIDGLGMDSVLQACTDFSSGKDRG